MSLAEIKKEIDILISSQNAVDFDNKKIYKKSINELREFLNELEKEFDINDRKFRASMGEVDIPEDFEAQFNDYVNKKGGEN